MGALTTHILDTAHGRPAAAVQIDLYAQQGAEWVLLRSVQSNADGRCDAPLLQGADLSPEDTGWYSRSVPISGRWA